MAGSELLVAYFDGFKLPSIIDPLIQPGRPFMGLNGGCLGAR